MTFNKNDKCIIAIDIMGGDHAPLNPLLGAADAKKELPGVKLLLVGPKDILLENIKKENLDFSEDDIVHADEVIGMSDTPTAALRTKRNSSIVVGANLVKDKKAHAFLSAGNTGAMMAAGTLIMGRIKGVGRPTIGAPLPTQNGGVCHLFDAGASVDSKPQHLYEYALLSTIFAREIYNKEKPSIGLLNVGHEASKGNELTFASAKKLENSGLNFYGNVEGNDILKGTVDIVLCDGFVGNVVLKLAESMLVFLKTNLKNFAEKSFLNKLRVLFMKGTLKEALKDMDYQSQGGVPLLGVNGICLIGHGSSSPLAIKNMILKAEEMHRKNLINKFEETLAEND